jgi:hypothetical protein
MIILVMAIITSLQGCSELLPSDRSPDATWVASDGHTYHGWRKRNTPENLIDKASNADPLLRKGAARFYHPVP